MNLLFSSPHTSFSLYSHLRTFNNFANFCKCGIILNGRTRRNNFDWRDI